MAQAPTISSADNKKLSPPLLALDATPPAPPAPKVCSSCGREMLEALPLPPESATAIATLTSTHVATTSVTSTSMTASTVSMTTTGASVTRSEPAPAASCAALMVEALLHGRQREFERVYKTMKGEARAQAKQMKLLSRVPELQKEMVDQSGWVIDRLTWRSMTPLMAAARMDNLHALMLLLQLGASPNRRTDLHGPPLMHAKSARCLQRLLDSGADVNARCKLFGTVLSRAVRENLEEKEIRVLLAAGANVNQLAENNMFAQIWNILMTPRLQGQSIKAHEAAPIKASALMVAADKGEHGIIKLLLEHGADTELKGGALDDTALMIAVAAQHRQAVQALLDGGADVNAMAKDGNTPLSLAAARNNVQLMQMLSEAGAEDGSAS